MIRTLRPTARMFAVAFLAIGGPVSAQGPALDKVSGEPELLNLVRVQKELQLSDEKVKEVSEIVRTYVERRRQGLRMLNEGFKEVPRVRFKTANEAKSAVEAVQRQTRSECEKRLDCVLSANQMTRYRQIYIQVRNVAAFGEPEIHNLLRATDEQKAALLQIVGETRAQLMIAQRPPQPADPKARKERFEQRKVIQNRNLARAIAVLTADQKKIWKAITGEPCDPYGKDDPAQPKG